MNAPLKPFIAILLAGLLLCACGSPAMRAQYPPTPPPKLPSIHTRLEEMYPDNPQAQALVKAARRGDVKEIDRLIDAGADPNAVGFGGVTVPGWVLFKPNKAGFRRLLERGADPNKIWYRGQYFQKSLMHMAVEQSPEIGVDYLRMCLKIGKGDPNLEPPDKAYRVLDEAVKPTHSAAFAVLYKAGAQIDYATTGFRPHTLVEKATLASNYKLTLFLLEQGVSYSRGNQYSREIYDTIQLCLRRITLPRVPALAQYMWFWRCVDWLEKHGMVFDYTPDPNREPAVKPAVLDTTPPDILGPEANK